MTSKGKVLVCGGAGFIGSHTVVDLFEQGYQVVILDSLENSCYKCVERIGQIIGEKVQFHQVDLCDKDAVDQCFAAQASPFDFVVHFAGLKAVGESVQKPLLYYRNNITSTINLLEVMDKYGCRKIVFSSSATVYGDVEPPFKEDLVVGLGLTSPYGQTKFFIERILKDYYMSQGGEQGTWAVTLLRYFNPVGAHPSGLIGEDPLGIPNNLMPFIAQVAVGKRAELTVFGDDYPTPDGTAVRDYLHVMDLAKGHTAAITHLASRSATFDVYNLGTGKGVSVMEMLRAMERACGHEIPFKIGPRRPGDIPAMFANADLAKAELGWQADKTIDDFCRDMWNWQSNNPNGYQES